MGGTRFRGYTVNLSTVCCRLDTSSPTVAERRVTSLRLVTCCSVEAATSSDPAALQ